VDQVALLEAVVVEGVVHRAAPNGVTQGEAMGGGQAVGLRQVARAPLALQVGDPPLLQV